mmetsp:Transcript_55505/g.130988  ORF Transcript_55505/g.130988 Transcript_55505/m.130988 type:complete len:373 (+) Transcript_55505:1-1119(+)
MRVALLVVWAQLVASLPLKSFSSTSWTKVLLTDAAKNGAVCLDGSPGGFYIRRGDPTKWVVFHQGGGWCSSDDNCYDRSLTTLGSSKSWGPTYTDLYEGSHLFTTPPFDQYTAVYAMYCDGGSWTGQTVAPVETSKGTIYYRGRLLLDALIDELLGMGLNGASELLYAGCSAGGLTTYLHLDYVAGRMPNSVRVKGLADAMFSLEHDSVAGQAVFPSRMEWGYAAWNSSGAINTACESHYGPAAGWHCFFGAAVAPFVSTPLFVLNSKYDTWQEAAIIGVNCSIAACPKAEQDFWVTYGHEMVGNLTALPSRHGAFLTNCPAHCQTGIANWEKATINGVAMGQAFVTWYTQDGNVERWIEVCDVNVCKADTC